MNVSFVKKKEILPYKKTKIWKDETTKSEKGRKGEETKRQKENIARIANAVPVSLYSRDTMNVEIVVLNCQKCN